MADNTRPVLLTRASGKVARGIIPLLTEHGWSLRLTDIAPFADPLPANAEFVAANLGGNRRYSGSGRGHARHRPPRGPGRIRGARAYHRTEHQGRSHSFRGRPGREYPGGERLFKSRHRLLLADDVSGYLGPAPPRQLLRPVQGLWLAGRSLLLRPLQNRERVDSDRIVLRSAH